MNSNIKKALITFCVTFDEAVDEFKKQHKGEIPLQFCFNTFKISFLQEIAKASINTDDPLTIIYLYDLSSAIFHFEFSEYLEFKEKKLSETLDPKIPKTTA